MSYFNMVCDSCGREVQGITWVNGMKFCAKCYQEIFGNKNMTENLKNMYEAYLKILNEKDKRIAELEEQLKNATKQVRKEVCEKIRSRFLATCQIEKGCDTASFSLEVLNRILDQIQE